MENQADSSMQKLEDLCRFLAHVWVEVDQWARENQTADNMCSYPVVQGIKNQMDLMVIAEQKYDGNNIRAAVDLMLGRE